MKRRDFFKYTAPVVALPVFINGMPFQSIAGSPLMKSLMMSTLDRVLVIVQMQGGNDGLNTVIPVDKYTYLSRGSGQGGRSGILIPETQTLKLERGGSNLFPATNLNPGLTPFKDMFTDEQLAIVQGVGYPNPDFSHFRATDIWMSGTDSNVFSKSGWLGRYMDEDYHNYTTTLPNDPVAIAIGSQIPLMFTGDSFSYGMAISNPAAGGFITGNNDAAPNDLYGYELENIRSVIDLTNNFSGKVKDAYNAGTNSVTYPVNNYLGNQLKTVARLLSGGLETKVFVVTVGGFDTHAAQVDQQQSLLNSMSLAIRTFQQDLAGMSVGGQTLDEKVIGMTFSEFGRTIKSNATNGTDHGTSAPVFLFGKPINSTVFGDSPRIFNTVTGTMDADLELKFDFRTVYGSILHEWFEVPTTDINDSFGKTFNDGTSGTQNVYDGGLHCNLPILKTSPPLMPAAGISEQLREMNRLSVHPNPSHGLVNIDAENVEVNTVQVTNLQGQVVLLKEYTEGRRAVQLQVDQLPKGSYFISVNDGQKLSKLIVE